MRIIDMLIAFGTRRSGKTQRLIDEAGKYENSVIVVANEKMKNYLRDRLKLYDVTDPRHHIRVMVFRELTNPLPWLELDIRGARLFFDDVDYLLSTLVDRSDSSLGGMSINQDYSSFLKRSMNGDVPALPKIKKVIYNNPATIVIWEDDSKTVVKCQEGDTYDPEKGLTMCISKKALGNTSRKLNDVLHKWKEGLG